jgi:hypothetical protein
MSWSACRRFFVLIPTATAIACATASNSPGQPGGRARGDSSVITEQEIVRGNARTAYQTIERLRPHFLSVSRAQGSTGERVVYVDGVRLGTVAVLHQIPSASIREVRYLDAREATIRFGTGHSAGAIVVATKTGR